MNRGVPERLAAQRGERFSAPRATPRDVHNEARLVWSVWLSVPLQRPGGHQARHHEDGDDDDGGPHGRRARSTGGKRPVGGERGEHGHDRPSFFMLPSDLEDKPGEPDRPAPPPPGAGRRLTRMVRNAWSRGTSATPVVRSFGTPGPLTLGGGEPPRPLET